MCQHAPFLCGHNLFHAEFNLIRHYALANYRRNSTVSLICIDFIYWNSRFDENTGSVYNFLVPVVQFMPAVFLNQFTESPASNGQAKLNDIHMINLARVGDVKEKKEAAPSSEQPLPLNLHRVSAKNCITVLA